MKITIEEWAKQTYVGVEITPWVLKQWRQSHQIHPAPERVMRKWMVDVDAKRITQYTPSLVRRISKAA